ESPGDRRGHSSGDAAGHRIGPRSPPRPRNHAAPREAKGEGGEVTRVGFSFPRSSVGTPCLLRSAALRTQSVQDSGFPRRTVGTREPEREWIAYYRVVRFNPASASPCCPIFSF